MDFWDFVLIALIIFVAFRHLLGRIKILEGMIHGMRLDAGLSLPRPVPPTPQPEKPAPLSSIPLPPPTIAAAARQARVIEEKKEENAEKKKFSFEQQFGARLPVWIGGVALALSGFYLVKYSIENNLLTEGVRVMLGGIFGIALCLAGRYIRQKEGMADNLRIAQALCGAGIADLYATVFAATSLYHMIPSVMGFAGMAAITALAVVLSLRHGMPIALLGLLGGFITPGLIGSEHPSALTLFIYLYCVLAGLFAVIRAKNWWVLSLPTLLCAFVWVIVWMAGGNYNPSTDGIYLCLFILGVSATVATQTRARDASQPSNPFNAPSIISYVASSCAIALMGIVTIRSSFGLPEWGFYGLLSLGSVVLAYFRPAEYKFTPWIALAVNAVMLAAWRENDPMLYSVVMAGFSLLFIGSGLWLALKRQTPDLWAGLAAAASLGFYFLAHDKLPVLTARYAVATGEEHWIAAIPHLWSVKAIALAAVFTQMAVVIFRRHLADTALANRMLSIFTLTATAFIATALTIELDRDFLSIALAAQILATGWVYSLVAIPSLRLCAKALFVGFVLVLMPQFLLLASITLHSLFGMELRLWSGNTIPFVEWPLFQLGLPMACLGLASWLFRKIRDGRFVDVLEATSVMLGALMAFYLARKAFHVDQNALFIKAGFFERGLLTNLFFAAGLAGIYGGRFYARHAIALAGSALFAIGAFRIVWFDLWTHNPLRDGSQTVDGVLLLNSLLLPFGLPMAWLALTERVEFSPVIIISRWLRGALMLACLFALVSLNVRFAFHGENLAAGGATNAELYTYSIVWLLLGIGLLIRGTLKHNREIRVASLLVMLLTIGKVFLYDAGALSGLYRVFSFLGLGLTLIALSWFYTRFVFKKTD